MTTEIERKDVQIGDLIRIDYSKSTRIEGIVKSDINSCLYSTDNVLMLMPENVSSVVITLLHRKPKPKYTFGDIVLVEYPSGNSEAWVIDSIDKAAVNGDIKYSAYSLVLGTVHRTKIIQSVITRKLGTIAS